MPKWSRHGALTPSRKTNRFDSHGARHPTTGLVLRRPLAGFVSTVDSARKKRAVQCAGEAWTAWATQVTYRHVTVDTEKSWRPGPTG